MKTIKIFILPFIILLSGIFGACHKVIFKKNEKGNAAENFEYLWHQIYIKYSFFQYKNIDWQNVKSKYLPLISSGMSDEELFEACALMMNELRDGHANLIAPFDASVYYPIFLNSPTNFDARLVLTRYLMRHGANMQSTGAIDNCIIDTFGLKIGYLRYNSFMENLYTEDLDYILEKMMSCNGLILDVRSNGGGSSFNVFSLAGRFADTKRLAFKSYAKSGHGENDFDQGTNLYIQPQGKYQFTKPIAVLTNRGCYSATSFFTLAMKAFPYVKVIGDTTGGGLGVPNGGQMPNGWTYRFSVTKTISPDGKNYENGIPPDITVWMSDSTLHPTHDEIIERAIVYIRDGL